MALLHRCQTTNSWLFLFIWEGCRAGKWTRATFPFIEPMKRLGGRSMKVLRVGSFLALLFATTLFIQNANAGSTYGGHSVSHVASHGSSGGHSTGTALKGIPYHGNYGSGYGHGNYGHGGYYCHGGYYGHGYYGHYGYPYYGYYPHYGFSFGFGYGWPYYYSPYYYWPYYYPYSYGYYGGYGPYYGPGPYYGYGYYDNPTGDIRTEVKPKTAKVYGDGNYAGTVDSFDGWYQRLKVMPGKHRVVFRETGFTPYVVDIGVAPGQDLSIKYQMVPGNDSISDQDMLLPPGQRDDYNRGYNPND